MHILMLAPGTWVHSRRTLNCLLDTGHEVTFIDGDNPLPQGRHGFTFLRYPRSGSRFYRRLIGRKRADRIAQLLITEQLRKLWRQVKPDIVHVCWLDKRAYQCAQAGLKPLVLSVWGTDVNSQLQSDARPVNVNMAAEALGSADITVVDAPDMHEKCAALAGKEVRTEELHLGADTWLFKPDLTAAQEWRRKLEIAPDAKVFVSVRAMASRYGHHLILDAFARSLPRLKSSAFLVFKDYNREEPTYAPELRALVKSYGIESNVRWIEAVPIEKMPQVYALSDAIINYPVMDAFPVTFVEAAACERMVITCKMASYVGTFAEKYFQLVEPGNIDALADAMVAFVNETASESARRRARLSELRRLVSREYDESVFSNRLSDLYHEVATCYRKAMGPIRNLFVVCATSLFSASLL